jgi:sialate O-acetylesterase
MAVTMDVGNPQDIHPRDKRTVGHRLALWALFGTYGRISEAPSGPLFKHFEVEGDALRLHFQGVGSGLVARGGELSEFLLAGEDRIFHPARAVIEGGTILVRSDAVPKPVAARYGFDAAAEPNLFNQEGLPASSFRTDDWDDL